MTFKLHTSITKNCTFHSNRLLASRTTLVHPIEPSTIATQLCSHHSIRSFGTKRARTDNIKTLISSSLMALSENLYPFPSSVASITRNRSPSIGGLLRFVISFIKLAVLSEGSLVPIYDSTRLHSPSVRQPVQLHISGRGLSETT